MEDAADHTAKASRRRNKAATEDLHLTLSTRYRAPLMAFFSRRTGDVVEAEDLAQDVLARVLQRSDLGDIAKPDAFIFMTARNLLRDRARSASVRQRNQDELEIREARAEELSPERVIQSKQELQRAMRALAELGQKTRDMFILNRLEGMKYGEIADLYGLSVSAVEKHLIKAFAHMLDRIEDE